MPVHVRIFVCDFDYRYENKLAEVTGTRPENGENLQILHYANGNQYFHEHRDYFDPKEDPPDNFAQVLFCVSARVPECVRAFTTMPQEDYAQGCVYVFQCV